MDELAIVICTINRSKYLFQFLNNIKNQINNKTSVVVVDDGSTDDTKQTVKHFSNQIRIEYIYQEKMEYSSPAKARNVGWKNSNSKYISFTDPEIILPKNAVNTCYDYHQAHSKSITALKPIMMSKDETDIFFSLENPYEWLYKLDLSSFSEEENIQIQKRKSWRDNHFSMMPKQALEDVNGVNENFTSWGFEGIDLVERIIDKGYSLCNVDGLFVYHLWHEVNRNMDIANQQRKTYGIKNCGLIN